MWRQPWRGGSEPDAAAKDLQRLLKSVHDLYNRPIWLTEFALSNWQTAATPEQQQAYMTVVLPMLDGLSYVERYAWFALPPNPKGDGGSLATANLCNVQGELNALGQTYRLAADTPAKQTDGRLGVSAPVCASVAAVLRSVILAIDRITMLIL